MSARHYGITTEVAANYYQAVRICLDRHYTPPTEFQIEDARGSGSVEVQWVATTARERAAWANRDDATRDAGYACVLAAIEMRDGLYAMSRAQVGDGADYYIASDGTPPEDLETCMRLEVSGVDRGDRQTVTRRLSAKVNQVIAGGNLPAMAGVVGFAAGLILLRRVEDAQ